MRQNAFISLLAGLVLLAVPALGQAAGTTSGRAAGEQQVLVLLNQVRQQHGLTPFILSVQLRSAARFHSDDMLQKGYFDHDSPNQAWDARVRGYLNAPLIGEDLACGNGSYGTPEGIVGQWMHSAPHRAVILTAGFHRIGIGIATGTFGGKGGVSIATADFAA
jgi:uncharacterized protein YkwD